MKGCFKDFQDQEQFFKALKILNPVAERSLKNSTFIFVPHIDKCW